MSCNRENKFNKKLYKDPRRQFIKFYQDSVETEKVEKLLK